MQATVYGGDGGQRAVTRCSSGFHIKICVHQALNTPIMPTESLTSGYLLARTTKGKREKEVDWTQIAHVTVPIRIQDYSLL